MARILTVGGGGGTYEAVPEDYYQAKVVKIELLTDQKSHFTGELEDRWKMHFQITEGEHAGRIFTGLAKNSTHPKSKLRDWLKAFFGPLKEGDPIDIDDIKEKPCMILISHSSTTRDDGQPWCNVTKVLKRPNSGGEMMRPLSENEVVERNGKSGSDSSGEVRTPGDDPPEARVAKKPVRVSGEEEELDVEW